MVQPVVGEKEMHSVANLATLQTPLAHIFLKSAATVWCYHVNMDQNLWGMFPKPCWIYATKN